MKGSLQVAATYTVTLEMDRDELESVQRAFRGAVELLPDPISPTMNYLKSVFDLVNRHEWETTQLEREVTTSNEED